MKRYEHGIYCDNGTENDDEKEADLGKHVLRGWLSGEVGVKPILRSIDGFGEFLRPKAKRMPGEHDGHSNEFLPAHVLKKAYNFETAGFGEKYKSRKDFPGRSWPGEFCGSVNLSDIG